MVEKWQIQSWILKEKELLSKLSLEISRDFSISEDLSKKLIFETHLNLDKLKNQIFLKQKNNKEDSNIPEQFDKENLDKLLFAIMWAKEFIEKASKKEINQLKIFLYSKNDISELIKEEDSKIIKNIFSKKLLKKAKNPQNISEQIMWWSLWILNSWILITDVLYNLWKWIITSIPDFLQILSWKAEIENFKKV